MEGHWWQVSGQAAVGLQLAEWLTIYTGQRWSSTVSQLAPDLLHTA